MARPIPREAPVTSAVFLSFGIGSEESRLRADGHAFNLATTGTMFVAKHLDASSLASRSSLPAVETEPYLMKPLLLTLLAISLTLPPLIRAQDPTVTTPTARSEKESAEPEATPSRTAPAPEAPSTMSSPAPKAAGSPAAAKKGASPAASPANAKQSGGGTEATLRELESNWVSSVSRHDATVAQSALADDYSGVSAMGKVMDKRTVVAQVKRDTDVYTSAKVGKMEVRVFGNAAVIIGSSTESGKTSSGQQFNRAYRWTDTWILRNGRWQCVASQSSQVPR